VSAYDTHSKKDYGKAPEKIPEGGAELFEKVVAVNRCAKVVAGGRRFSFSALCVAGDKKGNVGIGLGKANEVADSIRKGLEQAKKNMLPVNLKGTTIPYETVGEHACSRVIMRPASPGTGIKAGSSARAVLELAGVTDILTKCMGSRNKINVTKATFEGLRGLYLMEDLYKLRGKRFSDQKNAVRGVNP
jgi:small subunit ribosomal protein S5